MPVNITEEQRRATRRQIQKAIDMKDPEMLERYIQAYEKLNPPYDDEALLKARKTLAALDAKEGINDRRHSTLKTLFVCLS